MRTLKHIPLWVKILPIYILIGAALFQSVNLPFIHKVTSFEKEKLDQNITIPFGESNYSLGSPTEIVIPSVDITAIVKEGNYDNVTQEWEISDVFAYHANVTDPLSGNTIIYAHNSSSLFGALEYLETGANAYLEHENGLISEFTYESDQIVLPTNTDILNYKGSPQLTLITCTGLWNEKRRLLYFKLTNIYQK